MHDIEHISMCSCGAITFTIKGADYSAPKEFFKETFGDINNSIERHKQNSCNYCLNNWGNLEQTERTVHKNGLI